MTDVTYKPVSVIVAFNTSGKIKPLYMQAVEDDEKYPIKLRIVREKESGIKYSAFGIFECEYTQLDITRTVTLGFSYREHKWYLM